METKQIGLGGGCHWCTEAVFQRLRGVTRVEQGYIASKPPYEKHAEAVIVHYHPNEITLKELIEVHLHTHKSTSDHSMRRKYRSAVYVRNEEDYAFAKAYLNQLQSSFSNPLVTQLLPLTTFIPSREEITDYFRKNPQSPFCKRYILPKFKVLLDRFPTIINEEAKEH